MLTNERNIRLIFGLKVKQLRQGKGLSFKQLSKESGMSVSYLNEIEKGKKYPKTEKIIALSNALNVPYDELVSLKLDKKWQPIIDLLQTGIIDNIPLHLFGMEVSTLMEIISNAPVKVNAFISTIVKIARNYDMSREYFYFSTLRSYQEMHENNFEELETKANQLAEKFDLDLTPPVHRSQLYEVLKQHYGYTIDRESLNQHEDLTKFRAVFLKNSRTLLINDTLSATQKSFLLGKELAFNFLGLEERPYTSAPYDAKSFEVVLNNFKASYFSVALFINRHMFLKDIDRIFEKEKWDSNALMKIMDKYAASPEMFLNRMTHLLTQFHKISNFFFLRVSNKRGQKDFSITKELHYSRLHNPHRNDLNEHYCRRWVAIRTLRQLNDPTYKVPESGYVIDVQRSSYLDTHNEYFCISIARPNDPTPDTNVSVTLGIMIDAQAKRKLRFLSDPAIPKRQVNATCERCRLTDCKDRAADPTIVKEVQDNKIVSEVIKMLDKQMMKNKP